MLGLAIFLSGNASLFAHEGHEHDEATLPVKISPTAGGQLSLRGARLSDGSVFVPKPAQFRLGIRSEAVSDGRHESNLTLRGVIVADPNHSAIVASIEKGILHATPQGFPITGARVAKGQTLAFIKPLLDEPNRIRRQAELARSKTDLLINEQSMSQLGLQLHGQSNLTTTNTFRENLLTERRTLEIRKLEAERSLNGRTAIKAPVNGEISLANAQIGALVTPGQTLFEIVDPTRLWVEAQSYDAVPADLIGKAFARTRSGEEIALTFEGQGLKTSDQSLPLNFRIAQVPPRIYLGEPVTVVLRTRTPVQGIVLPQSSLTRTADSSAQVWVQTGAERYIARPVQTRILAGGQVLISAGLQVGERVVSQGAWLLDQIR